MPVIEFKGDLLESDCDVIIHCCNCFNRMGSGIAKALADKYPGIREADNMTKAGDKKKLGSFSFYSEGDVHIFNLYGQYRYGTEKRQVNYEALIKGLYSIKKFIEESEIDVRKIGTYQLGCGLAGGNWEIVKPIIEEVFPIEILVYILCNLVKLIQGR